MTLPSFNPRVAELAMPPIPAIRQWAQAYDGRHGPLIDLAQAVPGYAPHPSMLAALARAAGSADLAGYGPIEGDAVLREAYARHLSALYRSDVTAGEVHLTAGCNQAFAAAVIALVGPGERVALLSPFYFNHQTTLAMLGVAWTAIGCRASDGFVPRLQEIAEGLDAGVRALVLVTPNNPTGAVYPPALLEQISALCRTRGVWLLIDETYRDFLPADTADSAPHALLRDAAWRSHVVSLYSFSKSLCIPGHRLGALTAGSEVVAQVAKVMDNLQICAPRAPQHAVAQALDSLNAWRESNRQEIAARAIAFRQALALNPAWRVDALGAYFAYVRHPFASQDSESVARRLAAEAGVLTVPGSFFGAHQQQHLRMAFANADAGIIAQLAPRLQTLSGG